MKQKIKKMVAVALLSMVILGITIPALPASAATKSVNSCNHPNLEFVYAEFAKFTNVSPQDHQVEYHLHYRCRECGYLVSPLIERFTEPHKQVSGTNYCACGYYLR